MKQYGCGRFNKERENARKNVLNVPFTSYIKNTRVLRVRMVALEKRPFYFCRQAEQLNMLSFWYTTSIAKQHCVSKEYSEERVVKASSFQPALI